MRVVTYVLASPELPPFGHEAVARILTPQRGSKGKIAEDWHPVIFSAPSPEEARAKAEAWWAEELAKEARRQEGYAKAAAARKAKST